MFRVMFRKRWNRFTKTGGTENRWGFQLNEFLSDKHTVTD